MEPHPLAMIGVVHSAGKRLRVALDEYLGVCAKMDIILSGVLHNVPRQYLDCINAELANFSSSVAKLEQAEVNVNRVRNRISHFTPLASLPPEILAHIFHWVAKPCDILSANVGGSGSEAFNSESLQRKNLPAHLDQLTHVCSYWRQVAIGMPTLWTHVGFVLHGAIHSGFLPRAEVYRARSGGLPIELHVVDDSPIAYHKPSLRQFLTSIRHRIESLNIVSTHGRGNFHHVILEELKGVPQPGILTKITTNFPEACTNKFPDWIDPANAEFFQFTTLHLRGLFLRWDGTAYHGLVDLRLIASQGDRWTKILESLFRIILEASPGLQILHFALQIIGQRPDDELVAPVFLNDLEVLSVSANRGSYSPSRSGDILRLVAPGSKPFRLSIRDSYYDNRYEEDDDFSKGELVKFFQRSNVTKFCAGDECPVLGPLVSLASNLEDLAFDASIQASSGIHPFRRDSLAASRLNSLTLENCQPSLDQLEILLQNYPSNVLILSNCTCYHARLLRPIGERDFQDVLALFQRYPDTKLIAQSSGLKEIWELVE